MVVVVPMKSLLVDLTNRAKMAGFNTTVWSGFPPLNNPTLLFVQPEKENVALLTYLRTLEQEALLLFIIFDEVQEFNLEEEEVYRPKLGRVLVEVHTHATRLPTSAAHCLLQLK